VVLGTERVSEGKLFISALVFDRDGTVLGRQDKVQLDPSEEGLYSPGAERRVFQTGPLTFGIAICHEGFRYPETVRWAARQGAQVVFQPYYHPDPPAGTFHHMAAYCRAAENTIYFATANYACEGSALTSMVVRPDGTLLCEQPHGDNGLLIADLDLTLATGLLASRLRSY
jgi:predicted amidohydrolase